MTRPELKELYVNACIRARVKPQKSEEDVWFKEFEYASVKDLQAAIDAHFKTEEWMPKESKLRPMVEQAQRARLMRCSQELRYVGWECPDCGYRMGGFLQPGADTSRRCRSFYRKIADRKTHGDCLPYGQICGAQMVVVQQEVA